METEDIIVTKYSVNLDDEGNGSITISDESTGDHQIFSSEHPEFVRIVTGVEEGLTLTEIRASLPEAEAIKRLSDFISLDRSEDRITIHYKGKPVHSVLSDTITRYYNEGRPFEGLVKFMERLEENPSLHSRDQLYAWAKTAGLQINDDGYIVAYRSVGSAPEYLSEHAGGAFVDGGWIEGKIPNRVGTTISMDRRDVSDDFTVECSHGLHVGTLGFAKSFVGSVLIVCFVDPADVVSVPKRDHSKMRTCRYTIDSIYEPYVEVEPEATSEGLLGKLGRLVPKTFIDRLKDRMAVLRVDSP